jgi:hypothetical protein
MDNIKILRLHNGEDIMARYTEGEDETVLLDNPMHVIFKRIPTGQTVMMMMPWLPIEVIKENVATIYTSDILTIVEPKEDLIEYYGSAVLEAQKRMEKKTPFMDFDEDEDDYDEDEYDPEELLEIIKERDKGNLH